MTFLKTSLNAIRRGRGEDEMDAASFLRLAREKSRALGMNDDMLKRQLNVGFSGGEKKRNEILQMAMLEPKLAILDETDSGLDIDALKTVADGVMRYARPTAACWSSPITKGCSISSNPMSCMSWPTARLSNRAGRNWRSSSKNRAMRNILEKR